MTARRRASDPRSLVWIALPLTPLERGVLDELWRLGSYASLEDVVRAGLYQLARQLDVPASMFNVTIQRGKR